MQYNFALQVYYNMITIPAETLRRYGVLDTDWNNSVNVKIFNFQKFFYSSKSMIIYTSWL